MPCWEMLDRECPGDPDVLLEEGIRAEAQARRLEPERPFVASALRELAEAKINAAALLEGA